MACNPLMPGPAPALRVPSLQEKCENDGNADAEQEWLAAHFAALVGKSKGCSAAARYGVEGEVTRQESFGGTERAAVTVGVPVCPPPGRGSSRMPEIGCALVL
jgi:hypothetical protein